MSLYRAKEQRIYLLASQLSTIKQSTRKITVPLFKPSFLLSVHSSVAVKWFCNEVMLMLSSFLSEFICTTTVWHFGVLLSHFITSQNRNRNLSIKRCWRRVSTQDIFDQDERHLVMSESRTGTLSIQCIASRHWCAVTLQCSLIAEISSLKMFIHLVKLQSKAFSVLSDRSATLTRKQLLLAALTNHRGKGNTERNCAVKVFMSPPKPEDQRSNPGLARVRVHVSKGSTETRWCLVLS